ncbi:hypothetical protein FSARC_3694 [Fusarium sarcochroum]|uniref:Uncharacterized protein n=1 Tax=Fusarium sarcochroum TaxID=1208366 RepID=A0A8H4U3X7_9HYPO|nr:hypothetical protein FSARC_3694 [Fusarium sarcochroum]
MSHDPQNPATVDGPVPNETTEAAEAPAIVFNYQEYRAQKRLNNIRVLVKYDPNMVVNRLVTSREQQKDEHDRSTLVVRIRTDGEIDEEEERSVEFHRAATYAALDEAIETIKSYHALFPLVTKVYVKTKLRYLVSWMAKYDKTQELRYAAWQMPNWSEDAILKRFYDKARALRQIDLHIVFWDQQ